MRALVALLLFSASSTTWACLCARGAIEDEFARTAAVFRATIVSSEDISLPNSTKEWRTQLRVDKVWKSDGRNLDVIRHDSPGGSCGIQLTPGAHYIIFAFRYTDGVLGTSSCSRTMNIDYPPDCAINWRPCQELKERLKELTDFLGKPESLKPNNAFERPVTDLKQCAAGASDDFAPAAHGSRVTRPAQRGR